MGLLLDYMERPLLEKVQLGIFPALFLLSLIISIVNTVRMCPMRRQLCYFWGCQLLNCLLASTFLGSTSLYLLSETGSFDSLLILLPEAGALLKWLEPISRAAIGAIVLVNAVLSAVERSTERTCLRAMSCFLALLISLAGPVSLLVMEMLVAQQEGALFLVWIKAAFYIIYSLCLLVVSITSKPNQQDWKQVGVVVVTALMAICCLLQECLGLWLSQLDPDLEAELHSGVNAAHIVAQIGVGVVLTVLRVLQLRQLELQLRGVDRTYTLLPTE